MGWVGACVVLSFLVLPACGEDDAVSAGDDPDAATQAGDGDGNGNTTGDGDGDGTGDGDATGTGDGDGDGDSNTTGDGDGDTATLPAAQSCAALADALPTRAGATVLVTAAGGGSVTVDGQGRTLRQVVSDASPGDTILLEDGTYDFPQAAPGDYTGVYFTQPDITLRSRSGDASAVTLDSAYGDHGDQTAPITIAASGIVIADLTVRASVFHLVHLWEEGDGAVLHNLRLIDGGQQFVKGSPSGGTLDGVQVSCSEFLMTDTGRDNVWGYGASDGSTTCYTGGIDAHGSRDWRVLHNRFDGIHCNAGGVQRPAHGMKADLRGGMTYTGGLSEHAIHMWDSAQGSAHLIDGNHILDCARGIGIGLRDEVYGTQIRNNMIFSRYAGSREHDVGIIVERGHDIAIEHNTIFYSADDSYPSAIEYRWGSSSGLTVRNNLTNRNIRDRDGATATLAANVTDVAPAMFVDAAEGELHLSSCDDASVVGAGEVLPAITTDFDGDLRAGAHDVGADQCVP